MKKDMALDARYILVVLVRWWWMILAIPAGTWLYLQWNTSSSVTSTPTYTAESRVLVQQVTPSGAINYDNVYSSQELARLYALLIKEEEVLGRVVTELGLAESAHTVASWVSAEAIKFSPLLEIKATHGNPTVAADVVNKLVEVFIDQTRQYRLGEVARLQSMAEAFGVQDRGQFLAQQVSAMGSFVVVKRGVPPAAPDRVAQAGRRAVSGVVLAAGLGLLLAFLLETLLDKVRSPEKLESMAGKKVMGVIHGWRSSRIKEYVSVIMERPNSRYSDAYRQMALSVLNSNAGRERRSMAYVVTSAAPSEGKTTTAVNLAAALAESGRRVLLVDGDLWRPTIHRWFGLKNEAGFANLFTDQDPNFGDLIHETKLKNLRVMTSGKRPSPQGSVLEKDAVERVAAALRNEGEIVLFDSPPVLGHSFASLLTSCVDNVIVVADADRTKSRAVKAALEVMSSVQGPAPAFDVVLNRFKPSRAEYYAYYWPYGGYYYGYGSEYMAADDSAAVLTGGRRRSRRRRRRSDQD